MLIAGPALTACVAPPTEIAPGEPGAELSGGENGTVFDVGQGAYSHPVAGLDRDDERAFFKGRALFRDAWVAAPASTDSRDGLGPLFNARACDDCHARDGRGRPPLGDEFLLSMLFRLSVPGQGERGGPLGEPGYGGQFQPYGIPGVAGEGDVLITYEDVPGEYGDGEPYVLRRPVYQFSELAYGPMDDAVLISPRVAPAMIGLGLLEAVPEDQLMALADPDDSDGDGISGRPNRVWDVAAGRMSMGRFGWKAGQPSVVQQVAGAFAGDIGLTSEFFPDESCTAVQTACIEAPTGGEPELFESILRNTTKYSQTLAVPGRRDWDDPAVLAGGELFGIMGCASCHTPELRTAADSDTPALAGQTIYPYSDLLLHDMGDGLADNRPDFAADGRECRTPPLWGIGLL
ncbi:MAG: di-heme oxidoredictase family protein, partial [Myxococcota bacterium]